MNKEILGIKAPKESCTDIKCPFHGKINVKKEFLKGKIIKKDINGSATIEWFRPYFIPKYERYEIRRSRMRVHNPACINAPLLSTVMVARTRPLSKTKNHVVLKIIKSSEDAIDDKEAEMKNLLKKSESKKENKENEYKETNQGEEE
jgi:small subunit ribosomal protein S17